MVAELAVLGAIGTTAGLISFLTTTVETLNKKYHDFSEGQYRLGYWRKRMNLIHQELRNWRNIWYDKYGDPFPDDTYRLFWGQDGLQDVDLALIRIRAEANHIKDFLYCKANDSPKVPTSKKGLWTQIVDQLSSERRQLSCEDDWLRRVVYALFQGSLLKERIDRLKDEVEMLNKDSRSLYWTLLDETKDSTKWIDPKELSATNKYLIHSRDAIDNMELLYSAAQDRGKWTLVLGKPSPDETLRNLVDGLEFELEFISQNQDGYQLVTVTIESGLSEKRFEISQIVKEISFEGLGAALTIKDLLQKVQADAGLRKTSECSLGIVATKLVKSIVLLYNAPWTKDLCTCGILIADTMEHEKDVCTFRAKQSGCHDRDTKEQRFLRLAVALAELCIAAPIRFVGLQQTQKQYSFEICTFEPGTTAQSTRRDVEQIGVRNWKRVQEEELLRRHLLDQKILGMQQFDQSASFEHLRRLWNQ
ncbi:uncharacterized protein N0V89_010126 [Didymosphaeria variabile]|uniref:Uncharacterized protein n=1 Tax=Didymosphaeria variabile TaxID=1932322 RepID=A0A9W9C7Y0_9PLEO|nr:uncharacterized protein N0V89_010126 [Didymosphaeria variabile]KAJ4348748.1 hypothetical protein N0V89_010126 [Didymosphaeria variabile]